MAQTFQSYSQSLTSLTSPSYGFTSYGGAPGPTLVSAAMVGGRLVLSWSCPNGLGLLGDDDARNPANYAITPPAGESMSVTDVQLTEGSSTVSLGVSGEFRTGGSFSVAVAKNTVRDDVSGAGNAAASASFTVTGVTFKLLSAQPQSSTRLRVAFSKPAKQVSSGASDDALNPANYAITWAGGTLAVSSVATVAPDTVDLTTASDLPGVLYTLTPSAIKDLAGNVIT
jgi:hypothetical protein